MTTGRYPATRFRRTKTTDAIRRLVREHALSVNDLIWPIFLRDGEDDETPVPSMPGVSRLTVDRAVAAAKRAEALGIPTICLFPYIETSYKTALCEEAWNQDTEHHNHDRRRARPLQH